MAKKAKKTDKRKSRKRKINDTDTDKYDTINIASIRQNVNESEHEWNSEDDDIKGTSKTESRRLDRKLLIEELERKIRTRTFLDDDLRARMHHLLSNVEVQEYTEKIDHGDFVIDDDLDGEEKCDRNSIYDLMSSADPHKFEAERPGLSEILDKNQRELQDNRGTRSTIYTDEQRKIQMGIQIDNIAIQQNNLQQNNTTTNVINNTTYNVSGNMVVIQNATIVTDRGTAPLMFSVKQQHNNQPPIRSCTTNYNSKYLSNEKIESIIRLMSLLRKHDNEIKWIDEYSLIYIQYRNNGNHTGHSNTINRWRTAKSNYCREKQQLLDFIGL